MWRLLLGTMGVKSLVQGLNAAATAGFEPRTVWSEVRRRNRLATAPPLICARKVTLAHKLFAYLFIFFAWESFIAVIKFSQNETAFDWWNFRLPCGVSWMHCGWPCAVHFSWCCNRRQTSSKVLLVYNYQVLYLYYASDWLFISFVVVVIVVVVVVVTVLMTIDDAVVDIYSLSCQSVLQHTSFISRCLYLYFLLLYFFSLAPHPPTPFFLSTCSLSISLSFLSPLSLPSLSLSSLSLFLSLSLSHSLSLSLSGL